MPRPNRIQKLVQDAFLKFGAQLASELAQEIRHELRGEIDSLLGDSKAGTPGRVVKVVKKRKVVMCPVPGCGNPGGGPKWGWFCVSHKDLTAAEKKKARAARDKAKA